MIIARTPLRISLVGGGTDIPAFYEKHVGCVVSFTISKYVYVAINRKFDGRYRVSYSQTENVNSVADIQHDLVRETLNLYGRDRLGGLEIVSISDIPGEGSGLGSSSSFTVGLVTALQKLEWDRISSSPFARKEHAEFAFRIEAKSNPFVGKQDHYAAVFGGLNQIYFGEENVIVRNIVMSEDVLDNFHDHLLLLWTGITRPANTLLKEQASSFRDNRGAQKNGEEMVRLAQELAHKLIAWDISEVGSILRENWYLKTRINPNATTPPIDAWYNVALNNGAQGGKLCGAGGGGFLLFWAPPDTHKRISHATGLRKIDFRLDLEGSKVIYNGS